MEVLSLNVRSEHARHQRPPRGFTTAEIERISEIAEKIISKSREAYPTTLAGTYGIGGSNGKKIAAACLAEGIPVPVVYVSDARTVFTWDVKELVKTSVVNAALAPFGLPSFDGDVTTRYDVDLMIWNLTQEFSHKQNVALIAARDTAFEAAFRVIDKTME